MRYIPLLALLLAGCASAPPPLDIQTQCPSLSVWTPADQKSLADALATVPADSVLIRLELDWERTRDALRACSTQIPPK